MSFLDLTLKKMYGNQYGWLTQLWNVHPTQTVVKIRPFQVKIIYWSSINFAGIACFNYFIGWHDHTYNKVLFRDVCLQSVWEFLIISDDRLQAQAASQQRLNKLHNSSHVKKSLCGNIYNVLWNRYTKKILNMPIMIYLNFYLAGKLKNSNVPLLVVNNKNLYIYLLVEVFFCCDGDKWQCQCSCFALAA